MAHPEQGKKVILIQDCHERHTHQRQELQQTMDGSKADDEGHVPQFLYATDVLDIRSSVQIVTGQAGGDP